MILVDSSVWIDFFHGMATRKSEFLERQIETVDIGGRTLAVKSAHHYRLLRAKGITARSTINCLTATYCIERRIRLLHDDRD